MNEWPKLLITCDTTTGISYWHIPSKEYLDRLCLEWVLTNLENDWYSYDRFNGSFVEFVSDKFKVDAINAEAIIKNGDDHARALKSNYEFYSTRHKLFTQCIEAITYKNGDLARDALEKYSELYKDDILNKEFFQLQDYTTCEMQEEDNEHISEK